VIRISGDSTAVLLRGSFSNAVEGDTEDQGSGCICIGQNDCETWRSLTADSFEGFCRSLAESSHDIVSLSRMFIFPAPRHQERIISLLQAGHRWGLKSAMKSVEELASLPLLSDDFPLQTLLKHKPETASIPGPHSRKAHYLTTNFTDFDIHQIIGHIEQQPGSPSYLAYHSKLRELSGMDQPTAKVKSRALNDAKLDPRDFLPSEFIGTEVDQWFQGSRGSCS
jgi:hypothetical protein